MDRLSHRLDGAQACLFDLDGVLTPTAAIHQRAWGNLFTQVFTKYPGVKDYCEADYFALVDGKPRYDGVSAVLASREITVPQGNSSDPDTEETICGMGNLKDSLFLEELAGSHLEAYPGSLRFLTAAKTAGLKLAVVSSSKNAPLILTTVGIMDEFDVIIDGTLSDEIGLPGKPDPATYNEAAERLGIDPRKAIIVEDALSGVEAGRRGGFGWVVGVDRGVGTEALLDHGASIAVKDLYDLVEER